MVVGRYKFNCVIYRERSQLNPIYDSIHMQMTPQLQRKSIGEWCIAMTKQQFSLLQLFRINRIESALASFHFYSESHHPHCRHSVMCRRSFCWLCCPVHLCVYLPTCPIRLLDEERWAHSQFLATKNINSSEAGELNDFFYYGWNYYRNIKCAS